MNLLDKFENPEQLSSVQIGAIGDISLLVAVGYDQSAVAFSVIESNDHLNRDLSRHEVKLALWPTEFPREPGLYLFTGQTTIETCGEEQGEIHKEVFHRCAYAKLGDGLSLKPSPNGSLDS